MDIISSGRDSNAVESVLEIADHLIEADAAQSHGRFVFTSRVGDDDDRLLAGQHGAGPRRVLAAEADVDAAGQVGGRELGRVARIQHLRAHRLQRQDVIEGQRADSLQRLVQRRPLLTVQDGVVGEVRRGVGLIGRDQFDERGLAHRLQRVVGAPLFADGRHRFLAQCLAAQRPGAVSGVHGGAVGKRQQLVAERVVQQASEVVGRPSERHAQIGTTDVADEQRVAGQDGLRLGGAAIEIVDDQRNRLGRVSRRLERLQPHSTEIDDVAVVERDERVLRSCGRAQIDLRPGAIAQFEVAGNEVGMEVREEDVLDSQTMLGGEREVLIHVTLRVDDGGRVRLLVADQIRGVREAIQIKLLQNHRSALR